MGGVNFLMHGAGWMEGGLHASAAKLILDADLLAMVATLLDPIVVDEASLALDAIAEVGPGGHFFGVEHTQQRFRSAFFRPMISDWRNYETWAEAGRPEAAGRAVALARRFLDAYEPPPMEPAVREELESYVARRVAEGGVPTDY
jgi:trimethylamine--corrinoid protein Co-methyltransferase